jgi:hypothetical protein
VNNDSETQKGDQTTEFHPHKNLHKDGFFLTDKPLPRVNEEWKSAQDRGHSLDPRIVAIVRLLARRAARLDYEQFVRKLMQARKISGEKEGNQ